MRAWHSLKLARKIKTQEVILEYIMYIQKVQLILP